MVGSTSSFGPPSRYCTLVVCWLAVPTSTEALVITGTRSPIMILAFSLLRARMRGLASTLTSESSFFRLIVAVRWLTYSPLNVESRSPWTVSGGGAAAGGGAEGGAVGRLVA